MHFHLNFLPAIVILTIVWLTSSADALAVVAVDDISNCEPCYPIPVHYKELGCTAIFSKNNSCCPERFNCPNFSNYDKTKCHLNGQSYNHGEQPIDENLTCHLKHCRCDSRLSETEDRAIFACPEDDQGECVLDNFYEPALENCIKIIIKDSCCPEAKEVCGIDEINKIHKCNYNGKDYWEGETIQVSEKSRWYECKCNAEFNTSIEIEFNKNCKKFQCHIELFDLHQIQNGCVPVYWKKEDRICPIEYKCPTLEETKELSSNEGKQEQINHENVCEFNKIKYQRGDKLANLDSCMECSCVYPPMIYCYKEKDC